MLKLLRKTGGSAGARPVVLYLAIAVCIVVVAAVLFVRPALRKGDGWIGVKAHWNAASGTVVVGEVIPNSPAYDVGALPGDGILSYDGTAVSDINTLKHLIRNSYIRQVVRIVLDRNGVKLVADTRIAQRPDDVTILPPIIPIRQGSTPPHKNQGLCIDCHTVVPPNRQ